jgi:hypothetical protein
MLSAFRYRREEDPVTAQVRAGGKPVTSAEKRHARAEIKKLVDAITPRPDLDYAKLNVVGSAVASLLDRPVHWQPAGLGGHTHVTVPVDDLLELARLLFATGKYPHLRVQADALWGGLLDTFPADDSYGGDALCGCPLLRIATIGHLDACPLPAHEVADAALLKTDDDTEGGTS